MTGQFEPHLNILPPAQQRLWPSFRPLHSFGFTLYGGTAVALRLGHRVSIDFDFFTRQAIDKDLLYRTAPFLEQAQVMQDQPDTLTVLVRDERSPEDTVKVSFFGRIGFGRVGVPDLTDDGVLQIASINDLMATKLKVVLQRVEAKDYVDISAMLRAGAGLEHGLASAKALFGPAFQPSECIKALVYFEGGDLETLSHEDREFLMKTTRDVRELPEIELLSRELISS